MHRRLGASQIAPAIVSTWLLAMTAWYLWTVGQVTFNPVKQVFEAEGATPGFLAAVIVLILVPVASFTLSIYRRLPSTALAVAGALAFFAIVVLSGRTRAALVALWMIFIAILWGNSILAWMRVHPAWSHRGMVCIQASVGFAMLSVVGLVLGLTGQLRPISIFIVLSSLTLIRLPSWLRSVRLIPFSMGGTGNNGLTIPGDFVRSAVLALLVLTAFVNLTGALVPETRFDALNYQLAVPRFYLEEHRIVDLSYFYHSYFARLANIVFALAMALGGPIAAKLLVFASGIGAAIGVYELGLRLSTRDVALWAAALFYSTPLVSWLSSTAYIDIILTMLLVASWLSLSLWIQDQKRNWLWITGILAGAALGAKITAIFALPLIVVTVLWRSRDAGSPLKSTFTNMIALCGGALVTSLPWFAISFYFTGNPVFPMLNAVFRSPKWFAINETFNSSIYGIGTSFLSLLSLPFSITFRTRLFDEVTTNAGIGISFALLPAAIAFLFIRRVPIKREHLLLTALIISYFVLWAFAIQTARFVIPLLAFVSVVNASAIFEGDSHHLLRRLNIALLCVAFSAHCALALVSAVRPGGNRILPVLLRKESDEEFLTRSLRPYSAIEYLNSVVTTGDRVIGDSLDWIRFYSRAPIHSYHETFDLRKIAQTNQPDLLAMELGKAGYKFLLRNVALTNTWRLAYLRPDFLDRYAELEYSHNDCRIYRLSSTPLAPAADAPNLLANPGLEVIGNENLPVSWLPVGSFRLSGVEGNSRAGKISVCIENNHSLVQDVRVEERRLYRVSHHTRSDREDQRARLQINWLDEAGLFIDATIELVSVSRDWKFAAMPATAPPRARTARIILTPHDGGRVCFDDASFVQLR